MHVRVSAVFPLLVVVILLVGVSAAPGFALQIKRSRLEVAAAVSVGCCRLAKTCCDSDPNGPRFMVEFGKKKNYLVPQRGLNGCFYIWHFFGFLFIFYSVNVN